MSTNRPVCNQSKQETSNICAIHSRSTGMGSGHTKHFMEEHGRLRLPPNSTSTQSGPEITVPNLQAHPGSLGLVNKTVVLGSGHLNCHWELSLDHLRQLPPIRSLLKQPLNKQFHTYPESLNLHVWYLEVQSSRSRASL